MADGDKYGEITRALRNMSQATPEARNRLFELLYSELKRMAKGRIPTSGAGSAITATIIVDDLWFKIFAVGGHSFNDRKHFFATAAIAMQHIIIDHIRDEKRCREICVESEFFDALVKDVESHGITMDDLCAKLDELEEEDGYLASIGRMRFIMRMPVGQIGEIMRIDRRTLERDLAIVKSVLKEKIA